MSEQVGPFIGYDLDNTLGTFTRLRPDTPKGTPEELGVRPNLIPLLNEVTRRGGLNMVTTGGTLEYAHRVLRQTDLAPYFHEVFGKDDTDAGHGKNYTAVRRSLGLTELEEAEKLLVTGDIRYDQPAQNESVFVWHPDGYQFDASVLHKVIFNLFDTGNGNFQQGFHVLYDQSERRRAMYEKVEREVGIVQIEPDITLELGLYNPHIPTPRTRLREGIIIPTVRILDAEKYRTNPHVSHAA